MKYLVVKKELNTTDEVLGFSTLCDTMEEAEDYILKSQEEDTQIIQQMYNDGVIEGDMPEQLFEYSIAIFLENEMENK